MGAGALIIGGAGFLGRNLAERLALRYAVTTTGREVDVRNLGALRALVARAAPQVVVNLAAITTVQETLDDPRTALAVNYGGAANLVAALQAEGFAGRLLQVSSSEVYGPPAPDELPLTERSPLRPMSPYALAKLMAERAVLAEARPFETLVARPFTHIGPGQSSRFSTASFALQIAEALAGLRPPVLTTGPLQATRDLTDVRDVARAYEAILDRGVAGRIYNVCSGEETPMSKVVDTLLKLAPAPIRHRVDLERARATEAQRLRGDNSLLTADTGWAPEIPLEQSLADILADARRKVGHAAA